MEFVWFYSIYIQYPIYVLHTIHHKYYIHMHITLFQIFYFFFLQFHVRTLFNLSPNCSTKSCCLSPGCSVASSESLCLPGCSIPGRETLCWRYLSVQLRIWAKFHLLVSFLYSVMLWRLITCAMLQLPAGLCASVFFTLALTPATFIRTCWFTRWN